MNTQESGSFALDFDSGIARINTQCCELLGFPPALADQALKLEQVLGAVHNEDIARVNHEARARASAGEPCHTAARMLTINGAWRWFDVQAISTIDSSGRVVSTAGTLRPLAPEALGAQRATDARPATILYVEDEAPLRIITARVLRRGGHQVLEAGSGDEAIALVQGTPIDLLITDLMLPGTSPAKICAAVLKSNPAAGIIVVTGWSEIDSEMVAVAPRAKLISKPFRAKDLAACAASLIPPLTETHGRSPAICPP